MDILLAVVWYHTPIPAIAFSHPFLIVDPSVLMAIDPPLRATASSVLARFLSRRKGSLFVELWPGLLPKILIPPSMLCFDLLTGLYITGFEIGLVFQIF